ncbi:MULTISPECIES: SDR family oxidoreductase [Staphylococcus]|uniref:SDR family NAD(P)-dependent oxidoreductase n=1 Tax=Staphylococcus pettenkoferi TaxID=170573 RepID=A0A2N6QFT7_9STAP|nr:MULTISPECIES: SDR family oxidoreductase [Staphylococcus]MBX8993875.1 SDR family oxidoreductase [Staphylococcus pettenkoferi]MCI2792182.1 SDR family oxidoreductase [Staphylococcus pettenkoferi]MCY1567671.1 SDR family oxidoreductase [Staphylococcus pettenkoferi]MCY1588858.1 SDR family oxidoreductase [Staphylococcus pettenkoferi]MCY1604641.1 SDR family oxidoreductase [Staphylococcus pettenkoferi]
MTQLQYKVAVVTGASSGIGKGIATALAERQVQLVLAGRNETRLEETANHLKETYNAQVKTVITDVTQRSQVEQLVEQAKSHYGHLDVIVNSAGQMLSPAITDGDVEAWETMIDVNVKGTLYGINAALPHFKKQGSGHIINIASISGFEVTKQSTMYSATKAAIHTITQGLEKELARTGIRVTSISPGMVDTPMGSGDFGDRKKLEAKNIAEAVVYALEQPSHVNVNEITVRPV